MDVAGLVAGGQAALAAGQREEARAAGRALEAAAPRDEAEWSALAGYFRALGTSTWADIMTERFLAVAPANVAARTAQVMALAHSPTRQEEAKAAMVALLDIDFTAAPGWPRLGDVYERFGLGGALAAALERALAARPEDAAVRAAIAAHCITHRALGRARAEVAAIRRLAGADVGVLFTAVQLAQRMGDGALADAMLAQAMTLAPRGQHGTRGWLVLAAARSGRADLLAGLMESIDVAALEDAGQLAAMLQAVEGRGFWAQERAMVARGLALEPGHAGLQAASRRLAAGALFAPRVAAPAAGVRGRLRRMVRWR